VARALTRVPGGLAGLVALVAFTIALTFASTARAQRPPPAPPPLTPPRAIDAGDVPYPRGASGEAVVVLELLVEPDGAVSDVRALDGAEPFAGAARDAARAFRFEPARRGDVPVRARIRMRVAFHPPSRGPPDGDAGAPAPADGGAAGPASPASGARGGAVSSSSAADGGAPGASTANGAGAAAGGPGDSARIAAPARVEEVNVRGARHEVGQTSFGGGEVRQMPGAFGDAFRAIEALPGVVPILSGLPFFFVRGAPPGNTGYFLDGVRVPLLYHLGFGPSVVHPGLIDHVDFYPGGFPAQYGRFTGGILSGETLAPAKELHGEGNVRVFDAGALVEAPFDDGRGSVLAAGRYSYTALALSLLAPQISLAYWDYQARVTYDLGRRDRIGVFAFGSYDFLGDRETRNGETKTKELFNTQFHRVDVRWDHRLSESGTMRLAATLGIDTSGNEDGAASDKMVAIRAEVDQRIAPRARLRLGADVNWDHYGIASAKANDPPEGDGSSLYVPRNDVTFGARADVVWRVAPRVEVIPGLRADVFSSRRVAYPDRASPVTAGDDLARFVRSPPVPGAAARVGVDPRLATRVTVTPRATWISTFGVAHQPPSFVVPVPGVQIGGLDQGLQTSLQVSQGIELALPAEFTATATGFLHDYIGLSDVTATCINADVSSTRSATNDCVSQRVRGRTYGVELLVRRSLTKRLTGWLAYTLSRSTREAHALGSNPEALQDVLSEFDRTHVLSAIGAYDLGRMWRAGLRFFYYTGRPYTQTFHGIAVPPYNAERLPDFYRFDVRLEKGWRVGARGRVAFVVEGLNVTLHKEATDVICQSSPNGLARDVCRPETIGPVSIPSIGIEGAF